MKKQITHIFAIFTFGCLSLPALAQTTAPAASPNVKPPQEAKQAEPPKPIVPGGEQKKELYTPALRHDKVYEAPLVQPNVNDPVARPATTPAQSPGTSGQQPKQAPVIKEN